MTHILLLYPTMIPSVVLCGHSQLKCLADKKIIEYKFCVPYKVTSELASWADVVFFMRSDSEFEAHLAKKLKKAGKYLIYVLDDDLMNVPDYINSAEHYRFFRVQNNIREVMAACECLISPSAKLLRKYGAAFHRTALVEEPSIAQRSKKKVLADPVKIGFAGSIDRSRDIDELLTDSIEKLLLKYGDRISVEFFGARPALVDRYGLKHIPYCDSYEDYLRTMESLEWDIGLAPMPDTEFHSCKHYNKFIEYIGFGIIGVYSDVEPYKQVIRNGENGFLCANNEEKWYSTLVRLVEDNSLREKISVNCLSEARERFTIEASALGLLDTIGDILRFESKHTIIRGIGTLRIFCWCKWVISRCEQYGLRAPIVVAKKLKAKLFS